MRVFRVLKSGLFTTVQDMGRCGYLKYGVPVSGAMDTFSFVAANILVENNSNGAGLETTLIGPELEALTRTQIAITGGACSPKINGQIVSMWQLLTVREGDVVSFGKMEAGCRAYVALRGGLDVPLVLGSRSTYVRGGFGGFGGRALKAGDVIESLAVSPVTTEWLLPQELRPLLSGNLAVHVVLGPQADMFTNKAMDAFLSASYKVTVESDRMGYRLEGPSIEHRGKAEIVSDALLPGSVQIPRSGKPIVIMRDAQTTGGYPKIAVVVSCDVSLLGQAKPTDMVEFSKLTLKQAHEKTAEHSRRLNGLASMLRKA